MSATKIEWCDVTINPVVGCSKCSPGCDHCYAEKFAARLVKNPLTRQKYAGTVDSSGQWTGKINGVWMSNLPSPRDRKKKRIFIGSMGDMFHENVRFDMLTRMFAVAAHCPQHTFMFLTKRPERMREFMTDTSTRANDERGQAYKDVARIYGVDADMDGLRWPLPNVWLGVTVCNQQEADEKLPVLLDTPAVKRFVSVEPMLGAVDIAKYLYGSYECGLSCGKRMAFRDSPEKQCTKCGFTGPDDYATWGDGDCEVCPKCGQDGCCGEIEEICPDCGHYMVREHPDTPNIDWVICGGETGPEARPVHPAWVRSLRDQCQADYVKTPFFFKDWGGWLPTEINCDGRIGTWFNGKFVDNHGNIEDPSCNMSRAKSKIYGHNLLDGREWNEFPTMSHPGGHTPF